jgi:hypothetical protein
MPMFQVVQIHTTATPPDTYAPISAPQGTISPLATGLAGLAAGALLGAGYVASRKFSTVRGDESVPGSGPPPAADTPESGPQQEQRK